jgi:hypothetical protein
MSWWRVKYFLLLDIKPDSSLQSLLTSYDSSHFYIYTIVSVGHYINPVKTILRNCNSLLSTSFLFICSISILWSHTVQYVLEFWPLQFNSFHVLCWKQNFLRRLSRKLAGRYYLSVAYALTGLLGYRNLCLAPRCMFQIPGSLAVYQRYVREVEDSVLFIFLYYFIRSKRKYAKLIRLLWILKTVFILNKI